MYIFTKIKKIGQYKINNEKISYLKIRYTQD